MIIHENMADSINRPGRLFNFGPKGGRLFEGGRLLFSQHFLQTRTFLGNNKTWNKKLISLQQDKTKCTS